MNEDFVPNQEQELEPSANEETTEVEDTSFADMLFDEEVETPTTETEEKHEDVTSEEVAKEEEKASTDVPQDSKVEQEQSPFMTIKYNSESKNLTQEEAITLAQKGMNYDTIYQRYQDVKDNEGSLKELRRIADANNMSVGDFMHQLSDFQRGMELDKEIAALKEQYPNSDEALLKELANAHLTDKATMISKKQEQQTADLRAKVEADVNRLKELRPNIDPSKLDMDVYDMVKNGKCQTLTEAYLQWESIKRDAAEQQRLSLEKVEKLNAENKKKSLGNTSSNDNANVEDELVSILFSD